MVTRETLYIETVPSYQRTMSVWGYAGLLGGLLLLFFPAIPQAGFLGAFIMALVTLLLLLAMDSMKRGFPMPMTRLAVDLDQVQVRREASRDVLTCPTREVWWRFVAPTLEEMQKGAGKRVIHLEILLEESFFYSRKFKLRCGLTPEAFSLLKEILEQAERPPVDA